MIEHKLSNKKKSTTVAEPKLFHQLNNPWFWLQLQSDDTMIDDDRPVRSGRWRDADDQQSAAGNITPSRDLSIFCGCGWEVGMETEWNRRSTHAPTHTCHWRVPCEKAAARTTRLSKKQKLKKISAFINERARPDGCLISDHVCMQPLFEMWMLML
jgi:hypothetical protein